jgi:hypothetical protein
MTYRVQQILLIAIAVGLIWKMLRAARYYWIPKDATFATASAGLARIKAPFASALWIAGIGLSLLGSYVGAGPPARVLWLTAGCAALVILPSLGGIVRRRYRRKFLRRVERESFLVCLNCHYSVKGHPEGGRCPECGTPFTPESLRQTWKDVELLNRNDLE